MMTFTRARWFRVQRARLLRILPAVYYPRTASLPVRESWGRARPDLEETNRKLQHSSPGVNDGWTSDVTARVEL